MMPRWHLCSNNLLDALQSGTLQQLCTDITLVEAEQKFKAFCAEYKTGASINWVALNAFMDTVRGEFEPNGLRSKSLSRHWPTNFKRVSSISTRLSKFYALQSTLVK